MNNIELYAYIQGSWHVTEIVTNGEDKVIYCGKCSRAVGGDNEPVWCIKRITITNVDNVQKIVEEFADGNLLYDNIWADRANLTYKFII